MFYISFGCSYIDSTASFRLPWGLEMVPALALFFGCMFIPRSPRWLARKGRWEEAEHVLALLHGGGEKDHPYVKQEMEEIHAMVDYEQQNSDATFGELFRRKNLNRTHIGIFTQIWSQLTGMNVMMYYITVRPPAPAPAGRRLTRRNSTSLRWPGSRARPCSCRRRSSTSSTWS